VPKRVKWTEEDIERGYLAYREAKSLSAAAELCGISAPVLCRWANKHNWKARVKYDSDSLAIRPFNDNQIEEVIKKLDVGKEDAEVLKQCKAIEGICLRCLKGYREEEEFDDDGAKITKLRPRSFVEAINAMDKCWKTRENILHRGANKSPGNITIENAEKVDMVGAAMQNNAITTNEE
jgi:hypothetical protein